RDFEAAATYFSPTYIQHSAGIAPGRDGLFALVRGLTRRYESSLAVAEGDYVMVHGRFSGGGRPTRIVVDILRIADGRLAEHLDGQPIRSCVTPVAAVAGKKITTIEAIGDTPAGKKIQQAWLALEVVQCGYCQSGQIMSAAALVAKNSNPSDADIDAAMSGNICRCGTYQRIRAAIKQAARAPSAVKTGG